MKNSLRVHYDEEGDFFEIISGIPAICYGEEIHPGIFLRIDNKTEEIKGISIFSFMKRIKKKKAIKINLPKILNFHPPQ